MTNLAAIVDPKNFGKLVLEVTSWENDGDHYQTNLFFMSTKEELDNSIEFIESLKDVPDNARSSDLYEAFGEVYEAPKFKVFGVEISSLAELSNMEDEYYEKLEESPEDPKGLFGNGMFLETYEEFVGGFQYETSIIRRLDSYNVYKLDEQGKLSKIEKTS